jgi:hypothetical protein
MPWYEPKPRPNRQYVFRSRRCRQRIAQALGFGMAPERVAAVERIPTEEVRALVGDGSFRALIRHYEDVAALPEDEKLRRLIGLAGEMLERLVATGDLRAITFVLHEARAGRDPRERLARSLIGAQRQPAEPAEPRPNARRPSPAAAVGWPRPLRITPPGAGADSFAFCAVAQQDDAAAMALAASEAARVEARLQAAAKGLRAGLAAEAERRGTVAAAEPLPPPDPAAAARAEARAVARALCDRGGRAVAAAAALQARRAAWTAGLPADPLPAGRPSEEVAERPGEPAPDPPRLEAG